MKRSIVQGIERLGRDQSLRNVQGDICCCIINLSCSLTNRFMTHGCSLGENAIISPPETSPHHNIIPKHPHGSKRFRCNYLHDRPFDPDHGCHIDLPMHWYLSQCRFACVPESMSSSSKNDDKSSPSAVVEAKTWAVSYGSIPFTNPLVPRATTVRREESTMRDPIAWTAFERDRWGETLCHVNASKHTCTSKHRQQQ